MAGRLIRRLGAVSIACSGALWPSPIWAQALPDYVPPSNVVVNGGNLATPAAPAPPVSHTLLEFWLAVVIAVFGLAVMAILAFNIRRAHAFRPEDITRPVVVTAIITGTLMLVTVGYSDNQIAPVFGLFGAIAGYLFGRFQAGQASEQPPPPAPATVARDRA
ncbi:MAG: hypothetical protein U1E56_02790 [Bauldia sp.]